MEVVKINESVYMVHDVKVNVDDLRNVCSFLAENEQYGDDWMDEIESLTNVIYAIEDCVLYD